MTRYQESGVVPVVPEDPIHVSRCVFDGRVHIHEQHQLVVPLNAPMDFEVNGRTGRADLFNVLLLPRHTRHAFDAPVGGSYLVINVAGDDDRLLANTGGQASTIPLHPPAARFSRYLAYEAQFNRAGLLAVARPSLDILTAMMLCSEAGPARQDRRAERLAAAHNHLLDPRRTRSIASVAEAHGFSPANFRRVFRKEYGLSPRAAVTQARIDHARAVLEQTDESVKSIALSFGYENTSSFIDIFERHVGLPPTQYRSNQRRGLEGAATG